MSQSTEHGQDWSSVPGYNRGEVLFGFGDRHDGDLPLHRLTVGEARAIAADLLATAEYVEERDNE